MPEWFDSHLDLACLARLGRDMVADDPARCDKPWPPCAVTLPSLAAGRVRWCLATIFTEADGTDAVGYPAGNASAAASRGREQLDVYRDWTDRGLIRPWNASADAPGGHDAPDAPLHAGLLVEGADPIAEPSELSWWVQQGVVAVGLAWAKSSRYAGGNTTDDPLTPLGEAMVREMDRLGVVHDLSHLSDRSLARLLELTDRPVIASHSNCRALIDVDGEVRQRHLTDATIREIARRGGVIGVNVFSPFILPGAIRTRRATLAEWAAHVDRICDLQGTRACVGLGTDMDGGFSAAMMPEGVDLPRDLVRLAETLHARGWSDREVAGFRAGNWLEFWRRHLPAPTP
jgi:membrane dipeptidase